MKRYLGISFAAFCGALLFAGIAVAKPNHQPQEITNDFYNEVDVVGDVDGSTPAASKVLQDTVWIADWNFDGAMCQNAGWVRWDNRILNVNNDAEFWHIDNRFAGQGGVIIGQAAILSKHDLCWAGDGVGNDNDFSIILKYSGSTSTLDFDKASDSEPGFDFITVETDSLGLSEARTNLNVNPQAVPDQLRDVLLTGDALDTGSHVGPLALTDYGAGTHEVYIRFESDGGYSDEDGDYPTLFQAGLIVDNIVLAGPTAYSENFEDGTLNAPAVMIETALATGLSGAPWWRTLSHLTDNDKCTENITCAWIDTDPTRIAFLPSMNFGPGQAVIRNWLDDIMSTPWASFASTPGASGTILAYRIFPGNNFANGPIVIGWRVRAKVKVDNTDSVAPGDSIDCISAWGHASNFSSLTLFQWTTSTNNATAFFPGTGTELQASFRTSDWQLLTGASPPMTLNPGPGPYVDRVRIGRRVLSGPTINEGIDSRTQANDAFPTVLDPSITPGDHYVPDGANRFGTCAFSEGTDVGINTGSTRHITGDSIQLEQVIARAGAGPIQTVRFYGAITSGPHAGKVPGPYASVGGFFEVLSDSARGSSGIVVNNRWFVDLDDSYFRGGDTMKYYWAATDVGGFTSTPVGLTALATSVAQAEVATGGLHEVNYLPTVNWDVDPPGADPSYRASVLAHGTGDIDPTPAQLAVATQKNCILYYQLMVSRRRSGDLNRTALQYSLDDLGYRGDYDTYDPQGYGNTVNQLGSRANVAQASGYALIIQDGGRSNLTPNLPQGEDADGNQLDQASWFRSYLAQGVSGLAGSATLWLIGENTAFTYSANPLISTDFGLTSVVDNQGLTVNPNVRGVGTQVWEDGTMTSFSGDEFALQGGCPAIRAYDMASPTAGSTITHRYAFGMATSTGGAVVMNRNAGLDWNTIWQGWAWQDIRFAGAPTNPAPARVLLDKIIDRTVLSSCLTPVTTGNGEDPPVVDAPPAVSSLHQNVPNPFNPTTKISFDLARDGHVKLQVFNVAGHLVKTLQNGAMQAKRGHEVVWNGLDEAGNRAPSGVYFYQLVTDDLTATKKMALLK